MFWIVDHGSSPRGETAQQRLHQVDSRTILVHPPVHASWLNQVEISCSIIQRKVLTPKAFATLEALQLRLAWYEELSNQRPTPFQWTCDRTELVTLLTNIEAHPNSSRMPNPTVQSRQRALDIIYGTEH